MRQHAVLKYDRYLAQIDIGGQSFANVAAVIERLAVDVAPAVRAATRPEVPAAAGQAVTVA